MRLVGAWLRRQAGEVYVPDVVCLNCNGTFHAPPIAISRGRRLCSWDCRSEYRSSRGFWDKVDKAGGPNACWTWKGYVGGKGYGRYGEKKYAAHRLAWELTNGAIPDGLIACHRCDNPPCVNPAHIFLGTHKDNVEDCIRKNRRARLLGVKQSGSKLTDDAVREIRIAAKKGETQASIGAKHGVNQTAISRVLRGEHWGHVKDAERTRALEGWK